MIQNFNDGKKIGGYHYYLLISSQAFGSEKFTIGKYLINFEDAHIAKVFQTIPESPGKTALNNSFQIPIELPRFVPENLAKLKISPSNIHRFINYLIFKKFLNTCFSGAIAENQIDELFLHHSKGYVYIMDLIKSVTGGRVPYIRFDEIGENWNYFEHTDIPNPTAERQSLRRYYDFWSAMVTIMKTGTFVFASGTFNLVNVENLASEEDYIPSKLYRM
jgi:hypothetical protein